MKTLGIYTYSNTMNAQKLASLLAYKLSSYDIFAEIIELPTCDNIDYDEICIIYSESNFACPEPIISFSKQINKSIAFSILKLVNSSENNPDASYQLVTNLTSKGCIFQGEMIVAEEYDIDNIAYNIINTSAKTFKSNSLSRLFTNIKIKRQAKVIAKTEKHVSKNCTKCNLCIQYCPYGNIDNVSGKIIFKDKCINCFKCVYICPEHAIKITNKKKIEISHFQYTSSSKYRLTHRQYQNYYLHDDLFAIINEHPWLTFSEAFADVRICYGYLSFNEPFLEEKKENNFIYLHNNLNEEIFQKLISKYKNESKASINFLTSDISFFENKNVTIKEYYELSAPKFIMDSWTTRDDLNTKKLNKHDYSLLYSYKFIDEYEKGANYSKRNATRTFDIALEAQMLDYYMIFEDNEGCGIVCIKDCNDKIVFADFSILDYVQNQHYGSTLLKEAIANKISSTTKNIVLIMKSDSKSLPIMNKLGFNIEKTHYFITKTLVKEEN